MDARLQRLAQLHGIEPTYLDVWKKERPTPEATVHALLAAMGVESGDAHAVEASLAAAEQRDWERVVPAITVLRAAQLAGGVRIRLRRPPSGALVWRLAEESGEVREESFDPASLAVTAEPERGGGHQCTLALPPTLAEGYHRLSLLDGETLLGSGIVAVVPESCYQPSPIASGGRVWGPAVQLYGLRSARNAGVGDFGDLRRCAEIWGERGAAVVGTNPLHALSLRDPGHASPYSPSSRLFLNPIYVDVEAVADFSELAAREPQCVERWRRECAALRAAEYVEHARVASAKLGMFEALYASFRRCHLAVASPRARAFARFREARGLALRHHALHEALADHHGRPWREWPEEHREPANEAVRRFCDEHLERVGLHEYLQWQADLQLAAAQARCAELGMALGLYADLAISIGPDGSEAWANQRLYALGVGVGAPPDEFNPAGQDWKLPPLEPIRLREVGYAPVIATLRANMARAGALRIDHVMGLARLWWVPSGMTPAQGAYVRYPLEDLLGIVALESHRNRCLVIGEDLGTVSQALRERLAQSGVLSYRPMLFECDGARFRPPAEYPRGALVSWSTHDLPTFAGWWQEEDLDTRARLGLLDAAQRSAQGAERAAQRAGLVKALTDERLLAASSPVDAPATRALVEAVQAFIARTPSEVMVVQMEDVFGVPEQANFPGTLQEHPNWQRKLAPALEEWDRDERLRRVARVLGQARGVRGHRRKPPPGIDQAPIPRATYRLQLNGEFTFRDATRLVPYLAALGVSHVYCSPYLRARPGSKHGYDIIDHASLNPEIGTRADFDAFVAQLRRHGLRQLMDVVPNHMGVLGADNQSWQDLLENGPSSPYADFYDVDWHPPSEHLANRVLLPVLADHYGVELAGGRIRLAFEAASGAFAAHYYEHRLPMDPWQYPRILARAVRELEAGGATNGDQAPALQALLDAFARLPRRDETARARIEERIREKEMLKGRLAALAQASPMVRAAVERAVAHINGGPDDPASFDELHELLEHQPFRLAYWRVAQDEINYRRFFDINDLAALRQENLAVFEATHRLVFELVRAGAVDGLRIDHPDGLYDPREYFRRLQEGCGRPTYVVIEKIIAPFENLPEDWSVHGTTGYRFANVVNGLFVDPAAEARLTRAYTSFIGDASSFHDIARRNRRLVLRTALASELTMLASRLARIARADRNTRDFTFTTLRDGLLEVIAAFPVYRTYIDDHVAPTDRRYIEWAVNAARAESRAADVGVFDFLRDALTCELATPTPNRAAAVRHFARKFQQVTSPVMAKGVEDTAFYVYNRLLSLNDVGSDPSEFGFPPARFHRASSNRARHWPHTMLATSTHDNKRSEDVRARIDVISELVAPWRLELRKWHRLNRGRKREVDGAEAPSRNDEYLLYQTLLGSCPAGPVTHEALGEYRERIVAYLRKATREAKVHTSWANVNEAYEQATEAFVRSILDERPGNAFLEDLRAAAAPIAWIGYLNSLSMAAVKLTSPGVPDIYQGNETWDFSLVDPDNRRPVDYELRQGMLAGVEALREPLDAALADMLANLEDGRAKFYVLWRLLQLRRQREALFLHGGYTPVRASGDRTRHLVAFARRHGGEAVIAVAPRLIAGLGVRPREIPCGAQVWGATRVELPMLAPGTLLREVMTQREVRVVDGGLDVGALLERFPLAVLIH